MVGVMSAKWVGDTMSKSIYDELAELKSIPLLEDHPPKSTYSARYLFVYMTLYFGIWFV